MCSTELFSFACGHAYYGKERRICQQADDGSPCHTKVKHIRSEDKCQTCRVGGSGSNVFLRLLDIRPRSAST
ncbi:hypothetical protein BKA81DRAFT_43450 [Phyllosticta paracitricarpa]